MSGALLLPEKLKRLEVGIGGQDVAALVKESNFSLVYGPGSASLPAVSLLMPSSKQIYTSGDLFPSMDMNLPEGYLFQRILELYRKYEFSKMHLLALAGGSGIGRVDFSVPGMPVRTPPPVSRADILESTQGERTFEALMDAYLEHGAGISGVQPKVMVPSRATPQGPDLIVKVAGPEYPGLSANEFMCLSAAARAGMATPSFELSADGKILVIDRFDLMPSGQRLGFEDIAALMGLIVHDRLSDRKYKGSYEGIARVIDTFSNQPRKDLGSFFEQVALSVMVRNGDAHLKNFGLLYSNDEDVRLAPVFDVVTTAIYTYERPGGIEDVDRTMALRLFRGSKSKAYPTTAELIDFGQRVCGVNDPRPGIIRIAEAMAGTLAAAKHDARIPKETLTKMTPIWENGMAYAHECRPAVKAIRRGPAPA